MEAQNNPTKMRLSLAIIGALAGISFWYLGELFTSEFAESRWLLFATAATLAFFSTFLALVGPLTLRKSFVAAVLISTVAASLLTLASLRFADVWSITRYGHEVIAFFVLISLILPFVVAQTTAPLKWRDYETLFDQSWTIVVRYAAAWLFVGVSWAVVALCDALLSVVGINIIGTLLDIDFVPFVFTGFALGAAVAVVNELSDYVSAFLILRLLRLILPVFTGVVLVFMLALPFRGLSHLFGDLSPAGTLMSIAGLVLLFVSSAVDRDDECAVGTPLMTIATRVLALTLPVLAGLALYALWVRVSLFGWTPHRVDAAFIAVMFMAYGICYMMSVLVAPKLWLPAIRRANVYLALGVLILAAVSLTPILNPQQISASSQLTRYENGQTPASEVDLWSLSREWGVAGQQAISELRELQSDDPVLAARLERLDTSRSRFSFENAETGVTTAFGWSQVREKVPFLPDGTEAPSQIGFPETALIWEQVNAGCERTTPEGHPGCVALSVELLEGNRGNEIVIVFADGSAYVSLFALRPDRLNAERFTLQTDLSSLLGGALEGMPVSVIDDIHSGQFAIEPAGFYVLRLQNNSIFIQP